MPRTLGITCGIASVGWALLDTNGDAVTIPAAGVWAFDTPENPKDKTPLNAIRAGYRGQRRVIKRRRQRMTELRALFADTGLLPAADRDALSLRINPWEMRAAAFARVLTGPELAAALGHIARHRGFKSNSQRAATNVDDETTKMKRALSVMRERLQHHRTVGLMFATDPEFADRKRNRGDYSRSVLRSDLEHEARQIFLEQRQRGNALVTADLEEQYQRVAFFQRPLQDSERMVGACRFEPGEKRTALRGYSFEMFRLLARLANLTLSDEGRFFRLSPSQIRAIANDFGATKRISYRSIRETLDLYGGVRFIGVTPAAEKTDVVARQGNAAEGTYALRQVVHEEGWRSLLQTPALLDRIAEILTFRIDPDSIRTGLVEAGLSDPALLTAIMEGVETSAFALFSGTGHLSAKAARALLPALRRGIGYTAACEAAGYDANTPAVVSLDNVRNPVARKALTEALKQITAITAEHGKPDAIHVALMREVGKSAEERGEITRGIETRNKKREASRAEVEDLLGRPTKSGELLRYELWKEQGGHCLYTGGYIDPGWIGAGDRTVQIGHILPWSRFGDDSFTNKTLCLGSAGRAKGDRTPFEWFTAEGLDWDAFTARVEARREMKGSKKRGYYLRQNASEVEETFRTRHLSDTRYVARALLFVLHQDYPKIRVRARAAQLIAKLRHAWGLNDLKFDAAGDRQPDDRHRAADAVVVASISDRMLEVMARDAWEAERQGLPRGFNFDMVDPPDGFRDATLDTVSKIFPARAERRRVRGEAHAATIKSVVVDGPALRVLERKPVEKLTLADLDHIPTPAPYAGITDPKKLRDEMVETLRVWIENKKPKDDPPRSPKGDVIRKVRVFTGEDVRVAVRGGTADRGEMARVDVFRRFAPGNRPRYHLVPIYPHQVADRTAWPNPPNRAISAGRSDDEWDDISDAEFLFSLFSHSLIEVVKPDGEILRGYFRGLDRSTGAIAIARPEDVGEKPARVGARTLLSFDKLRVDRLGRVTRVNRETRTWHGRVVSRRPNR